MIRRSGGLLLGLAVAFAAACSESSSHEMAGLVVKIDPQARVVTVSHEPVDGFMDAMVMPFNVASAEKLQLLNPGDRIAFRLNVGHDESSIDRIRLLSAGPATPSADVPPAVEIGAVVPPFTLVDQQGRTVRSEDLRGRVVAISFIYTRCPLPDYCPRVMTNFSALRDRFADRLDRDLVLLTVTFDPKHDTAEKLREYGERYGANVRGWHLLTGTHEEIEKVCALFGVEFYPDEGMISHTLQTAIVGRDGRLAARAGGREYGAKQLGDLVAEVLGRSGVR